MFHQREINDPHDPVARLSKLAAALAKQRAAAAAAAPAATASAAAAPAAAAVPTSASTVPTSASTISHDLQPSTGGTPRSGGGSSQLTRPDVDIVVLSVCGKGGSMDVIDFCEACAMVARRVWPDRANAHPSELLAAFLDTYYPSA